MARAKTAGQAGEWNSRLNGAGKNSPRRSSTYVDEDE